MYSYPRFKKNEQSLQQKSLPKNTNCHEIGIYLIFFEVFPLVQFKFKENKFSSLVIYISEHKRYHGLFKNNIKGK